MGEMKLTDKALAIARMFIEEKNIICFNKHFYLFNDDIWRLESDENTEAWIVTEYIKKFKEPPKAAQIKEITKYISTFTYDKYRKKIKYINDEVANNTINVKSGILDLETFKITPYSKEAFCFYKLPFDYQKDTKAKTMMEFLMTSMDMDIKAEDQVGEYRKILKFIQEWLGYSLVAGNKYEKCLLMIGEGANGKSVLQDIWEYIIGSFNCSYVDLKYINDGSQIFLTRNKLVNFSKDLESNQQLDTGITKAAVSGQTVIANEKYKGQVAMKFTAKLVIACNELPYVKNASESVRRRFHILPFTRIFQDHEQDKELLSKLKKEADKIFSWAINGLKNLRERGGFDIPDRCKFGMTAYLRENDSIELWLADSNLDSEGSMAKTTAVYRDYKEYCLDSSLHPKSNSKVYKKLDAKGYTRKFLNGTQYFNNIKLSNQP